MKKIPTLFVRKEDDRAHVDIDRITPGCEWVFSGDTIPTRKYDGTCILIQDGRIYARREVKKGRIPPEGWWEVDYDEVTGKRVGWEPYEQSSFAKYIDEATHTRNNLTNGTYELVGPKINKDPERFKYHELIKHGDFQLNPFYRPASWQYLIRTCKYMGWEGIVWHHPDGRMCKLKVKDIA